MSEFSVGVEEEFHLVDAETGELRPAVAGVLRAANPEADDQVEAELIQSQVETGTPARTSLDEVRADLIRLRGDVDAAATEHGCRLAASGTYPGEADEMAITAKARYRRMVDAFGPIAREQVVCGCHVHVSVDDRDLAIAVLRRCRPWLPTLLALSANSPFWQGADTDYASYRAQVWSRWPSAGPPGVFTSRADYDALTDALLATGVILDSGMLYYDVRPSQRYETLEFRVADVCLSVDDAVLLTGLIRALVRRCAAAAGADEPFVDVRPELLRLAHWRAARSGLDGELVDLRAGRPVPARAAVAALLAEVGPALEDGDDRAEVEALVERVFTRGNGASRQRAAYRRRGRIRDVIDAIVTETSAGEPR